ncbi:MAG: CPBP family intramembrane glutamic endopeptidase [Longimicrobiales bacterium]
MLDHILVVAFAIGFPLISGPVYARRRPALLAGDERIRRREYVETILWLSSMGALSIAVWLISGRDLPLLGLGFDPSWQQIASLTVVLLLSGLLFFQVRGVLHDSAMREVARKTLDSVREYMPRTSREARLFRGVSISAGLGEEIFYRGFLLWYLGQVMSLPWAILVSSALFGLAHIMHGSRATVRSSIMGLVLAGLYVFSGSLWASMILHTAVDLANGEVGAAAFAPQSR